MFLKAHVEAVVLFYLPILLLGLSAFSTSVYQTEMYSQYLQMVYVN